MPAPFRTLVLLLALGTVSAAAEPLEDRGEEIVRSIREMLTLPWMGDSRVELLWQPRPRCESFLGSWVQVAAVINSFRPEVAASNNWRIQTNPFKLQRFPGDYLSDGFRIALTAIDEPRMSRDLQLQVSNCGASRAAVTLSGSPDESEARFDFLSDPYFAEIDRALQRPFLRLTAGVGSFNAGYPAVSVLPNALFFRIDNPRAAAGDIPTAYFGARPAGAEMQNGMVLDYHCGLVAANRLARDGRRLLLCSSHPLYLDALGGDSGGDWPWNQPGAKILFMNYVAGTGSPIAPPIDQRSPKEGTTP